MSSSERMLGKGTENGIDDGVLPETLGAMGKKQKPSMISQRMEALHFQPGRVFCTELEPCSGEQALQLLCTQALNLKIIDGVVNCLYK